MHIQEPDLFNGEDFLNLETFRKSGISAPTPGWFAQEEGIPYVRPQASSGKVKRIRANGRVRVAPCDARGGLNGQWMEGQANLIEDPAEAERVNRLFDRRYGMLKKAFDIMAAARPSEWATIAIRPRERKP